MQSMKVIKERNKVGEAWRHERDDFSYVIKPAQALKCHEQMAGFELTGC
jgi:hypothetical protein